MWKWLYSHIYICYTCILSNVSTFCAYLCPVDYPFGGFHAISLLMQNWWDSQTERKADLVLARPSARPRWLIETLTQHKDVTGLWKPATPADQLLISPYWVLASGGGYLIGRVPVFIQSGFHLIHSRRQVTRERTFPTILQNLTFFSDFYQQKLT